MMALMLKANIGTPEHVKSKLINLKIELNAPEYDYEGKLLHPEDDKSSEEEEDEIDDKLAEYFNAHLLDEEYLDA